MTCSVSVVLPARFRAENFNDAPARHAAHAERRIDRQRAGGDHADRHQHVAAAQPHDGALAVILFNLRNRSFQHFCFIVRHGPPRRRKLSRIVTRGISRSLLQSVAIGEISLRGARYHMAKKKQILFNLPPVPAIWKFAPRGFPSRGLAGLRNHSKCCHSERIISLWLFLNRRAILRFAQNDKTSHFFRRPVKENVITYWKFSPISILWHNFLGGG